MLALKILTLSVCFHSEVTKKKKLFGLIIPGDSNIHLSSNGRDMNYMIEILSVCVRVCVCVCARARVCVC